MEELIKGHDSGMMSGLHCMGTGSQTLGWPTQWHLQEATIGGPDVLFI
jgi:hypothetical protein